MFTDRTGNNSLNSAFINTQDNLNEITKTQLTIFSQMPNASESLQMTMNL